MRLFVPIRLCLAPLALTGCVIVPVGPDPETLMPMGQSWNIEDAGGMARPGGVVATLTRTVQGIGGGSGCNLYFGEARFGPGWLDFANIGGTEMACPEPVMSFEQRVLAALDAADAVSAAPGGGLTLMAQGRAVMRLAPQIPATP